MKPGESLLISTARRLCAPPGGGWAASSAGLAPLARDLHMSLYEDAEPQYVQDAWCRSLEHGGTPCAAIIGVPYDNGTYGLGGSAAGPLGIRWAATAQASRLDMPGVLDLGDIRYFPGPPLDELLSAQTLRRARQARFGTADCPDPICVLSAHQRLVQDARSEGIPVLSLGGDHSVAGTAVAGLSHRNLGLVYVDAHPDLSSGRDGLSLLHSSWIRYADRRAPFTAIIQVATVSESAPDWVAGRLTKISAPEVESDAAGAGERAASALIRHDVKDIYLSVDIDVLDENEAPATGLPATCGLSSRTLLSFMDQLSRRLRVIGADVTEVAPPLSGTRNWANEPTCAAGARIARALTKSIMRTRSQEQPLSESGTSDTARLIREYAIDRPASNYLGRRLREE
jgi:arginase family enzyme